MEKEKYYVTRDRDNMLSPVYWNLESQTSSNAKKIYGINLKQGWFIFKEGRSQAIYLWEDWLKAAEYISSKIINDKSYFDSIEKELIHRRKKALELVEKFPHQEIKDLDFIELIKKLKEIKNAWISFNNANMLSWYAGGDLLKKKFLEILKVNESELQSLTAPMEKTAVNNMDQALSKYAKLVLNNEIRIGEASKEASRLYGWIPFRYDGPEYWSPDHFQRKIKQLLKRTVVGIETEIKSFKKSNFDLLKRKKKIAKKYKIPRRYLRLFDISEKLAIWTDDRKVVEFQLHYLYSKILSAFETRLYIPYKNLKFLLAEELDQLEKKKSLIRVSQNRIDKACIVYYRGNKRKIYSNKETKKFLTILSKQQRNISKNSEISGIVSSRGGNTRYSGRVKIILSIEDCKKLRPGEFIAATMTSPDYFSAIKKSIGLITDEGGVTCHAAIIARELNKPCIISTKNATKILKDGDLIEMNTQTGVIEVVR